MAASEQPLRGAIVAMTRDRVIGVDGDLPWHYPADLRRFKERTMGCVVVMGRRTWESIGARPLPGRRNLVVSRSARGEQGEWFRELDAALDACGDADAWIIGGGQVYRAAMPRLNLLDVTWVPDLVSRPDAVTFPPINPADWAVVREAPLEDDSRLVNTIYKRRA